MKKIIWLLLINFSAVAISHAQYYTGIGGRIGKFASGVTIKHFLNADNATAFEIVAAKTKEGNGGFLVAYFIEKQKSFRIKIRQLPLDFVYGIGLQVGYYPKDFYYKKDTAQVKYNKPVIGAGICAIIGLEYKIKWVPFTIGVDAFPFFEFYHKGPEFLDFAVELRYVF